jgi:anaerobic selenocysteine-containing dehydrogenase
LRALRIARPAVRRGWLDRRARDGRGYDGFVEVDWDEALDLVAGKSRGSAMRMAIGRSMPGLAVGPVAGGSTTRKASCTDSTT